MSPLSFHHLGRYRHRRIQAVIFDKDGTLIDFQALYVAVGRARLEGILSQVDGIEGQALADDLLRAWGLDLAGRRIDPQGPLAHASMDDEIAVTAGVLFCHGLDWYTARAVAESAFESVAERIDPSAAIVPLPGVMATLRRLYADGFGLGLVTNDTQAQAEAAVCMLGTADLFDAVVGYTPALPSKPAPDMALEACRRLGVAPEEAAAVGDSVYDAQMARAAGIGLVVAVTTGLTPRDQLARHADVIINRLADLPSLLER